MRLVNASSAVLTSAKPESFRVPAVRALASTPWPSRVLDGLANAVDTGRATSLGNDAQALSHSASSRQTGRDSARQQAERAWLRANFGRAEKFRDNVT